jgi:hypothetical protein
VKAGPGQKVGDGKASAGPAVEGKTATGPAADGKTATEPAAEGKTATGPAAEGKTADGKEKDPVATAKADEGKPDKATAAAGALSADGPADKTKPGYKPHSADKAAETDKKAAPGDKTDKDGAPPVKAAAGDKAEKRGKAEDAGKAENKDGAERKDGAGKDSKPGDKTPSTTAPTAAAVAAASQGRATRVLRRANPVRVVRSTARSTSAWAKRPSGRLILPAIIAVLLLGAAGTAGAYLVPRALQSVPTPSVTPGFGLDADASAGGSSGALPGPGGVPSASAPVVGGIVPGTQPPVGGAVGGARPADVLASWAQDTGTRAGIPVVAVQAYGYAELVVARTTPSCHLSWTTIAAIAKVESAHGSANGAVLNVDGSVAPPIFGLPLDGKGGRQEIRDTDQGALDGDSQFDRALGPLQFIPQTWNSISVGNGVDADNNGVSDPNDIDDASLAAAKYLCQGGRDLARPDAWWDAILSYNAVRPYAQKVFDAANEYGQRSRV